MKKNDVNLTPELKDKLSKLKEIKLDVDEETASKLIETFKKMETSLDWKMEALSDEEIEERAKNGR